MLVYFMWCTVYSTVSMLMVVMAPLQMGFVVIAGHSSLAITGCYCFIISRVRVLAVIIFFTCSKYWCSATDFSTCICMYIFLAQTWLKQAQTLRFNVFCLLLKLVVCRFAARKVEYSRNVANVKMKWNISTPQYLRFGHMRNFLHQLPLLARLKTHQPETRKQVSKKLAKRTEEV